MLEYDEKRDYERMNSDCDIVYRPCNATVTYPGYCTSISGAGVSFSASQPIAAGKALEIKISPSSKSNTPALIAFIETIRSSLKTNGSYEIAAAIKGIKAEL